MYSDRAMSISAKFLFGPFAFLCLICFCASASAKPPQYNPVKVEGRVLDALGNPVPDVRIYRTGSLVWDSARNRCSVSPRARIVGQTDENGLFFLQLPQLRHSIPFFVSDESLTALGYFRVSHADRQKVRVVTVAPPAHIKVVFGSEQIAIKNLRVDLLLRHPEAENSLYPFITVDCNIAGPVHTVPLDLPCPADCNLILQTAPGYPIEPFEVAVPPLAAGQTLDLGTVVLKPVWGHHLLGKPAPELKVADWIKGRPKSLEKLRGKVVLLDFWGLWCRPCREMFGELALLHNKYSRDGLVIIAIHDSSADKKAFASSSRKDLDLSEIPFRIAIDSPPADPCAPGPGKGRTIELYGVSRFPSLVIIDQDGNVKAVGRQDLEDNIRLLLGYKPIPPSAKQPAFVEQLYYAERPYFIRSLWCLGIILLLLIIAVIIVKSWSKRPPPLSL
ncbi:MAG TPA: TlpA disulfide reductase family protein [Sedimentisphaerales bacterium]|nr:TlpA disulfide reductase family protein [Sedimentisphaerales bacterium]